MPDCLNSVWGQSVHFVKFPTLRVSKGCSSHSFHPVSTKVYGKHGNQRGRGGGGGVTDCYVLW